MSLVLVRSIGQIWQHNKHEGALRHRFNETGTSSQLPSQGVCIVLPILNLSQMAE